MFWIRSSEEEHRTFNPLVGISKFPESTLLACIFGRNDVVLSDGHMEPIPCLALASTVLNGK